MNKENKKMSVFLLVLATIEYVYLIVSLVIVFIQKFPHDMVQYEITLWVNTSYMILPVLFFKNILVAILNNGALTQNQKTFILVRCALYLALAVFSYPLIILNN